VSSFFKKSLINIFALVTFAGFMGCESQADKDRKPEVVEQMMKDMVERCEKDNARGIDTTYNNQELRDALMNVDTEDLEVLQKKGITIFADQRLSLQNEKFFGSYVYGIYYIRERLVIVDPCAWDSYSSLALGELAEVIRDKEVPSNAKILIGKRYGKAGVEWVTLEEFGKDNLENPQLLNPPRVNKTPLSP